MRKGYSPAYAVVVDVLDRLAKILKLSVDDRRRAPREPSRMR